MKKIDNFKLIYIAFFFAIFTSINRLFINSFDNILISGLLGAVGVCAGFLIYKLVNKKNTTIKIAILVIIFIVFIILIKVNNKNRQSTLDNFYNQTNLISDLNNNDSIDASKLKTCIICGYIAYLPDSNKCFYCYLKYNKEKIDNNFVINEQLMLFGAKYKVNKELDFYKPKIQLGFVKDTNWKPLVSKKEVIDFSINNKW